MSSVPARRSSVVRCGRALLDRSARQLILGLAEQRGVDENTARQPLMDSLGSIPIAGGRDMAGATGAGESACGAL
jgi:hypothetical protein